MLGLGYTKANEKHLIIRNNLSPLVITRKQTSGLQMKTNREKHEMGETGIPTFETVLIMGSQRLKCSKINANCDNRGSEYSHL